MKNNLYTIILISILGTACGENFDEPEEIDWYSDYVDTDGDGIPNGSDDCPLEQEDWSAWDNRISDDLTTDGCPTVDTDGDKIDDTYDACPNDPECWTDSCLVGMSRPLRCESHICYRGECVRNDIRYSCNYSLGSDEDQDSLWEVANGFSNRRGEQLIAQCEENLDRDRPL